MIISQLGGNDEKYVLTTIDDYTAFKAAYCMKSKQETLMYIKEFLNYIRADSNYNISGIRYDNGMEFSNHKILSREWYVYNVLYVYKLQAY